jgi:hypothetical protein
VRTAGIVMRNNTGYKVEENYLTQTNDNDVAFEDGRVYGIVVSNSGTANNQIYKNTFKDLYIGGQSELDNSPREAPFHGNPYDTEGGLVWKCNIFVSGSIMKNDMAVINGDIAVSQGQNTGVTSNDVRENAANNSFSLIGEDNSLEHDILIDSKSGYMKYYHVSVPSNTPDSYTTNNPYQVTPYASSYNGQQITQSGLCPSKISGVINGGVENGFTMIDSLKLINDLLGDLVDGGETATLVERVKNVPVIGRIVVDLLNKAPLSDSVLTEFIRRNPPASAVKTVLLASSGLSDQVYAEYDKLNLPIGIKNEIDMAQNLVSERTRVEREYYNNEVKIQEIFNDILREQWFDSTVTQPYQGVLSSLEEHSDLFQDREIVALTANLYATLDNTSGRLDELMQELLSAEISASYKDILMLDITVAGFADSAILVFQEPENITLVSTLANLNDLESESQLEAAAILGAKSYANVYLNLNKDGDDPIILDPTVLGQKMSFNGPTFESIDNRKFAMIYPNPSSGIVNIDFSEQMDGEMKIEVIDIQGKVIHSSTRAQANAEQMDFTYLNEGIYLIRVTIAQEVVGIERWIKQ